MRIHEEKEFLDTNYMIVIYTDINTSY
jgi:hypothetical protein